MNERFFTFTACHSGTGAASGKYEYASRGAVSWGRGRGGDLDGRAVVERERLVGAGLREPQADQLTQLVGVLVREVVQFSERSTSVW